MAISTGEEFNVAIIGNGPSALILSYILSGNIPHYIGGHDDRVLDRKLSGGSDLLHIPPDTYDHILEDINYSSQALPINILLDTLLRPYADTGRDADTCVEWRYQPSRAIRHVVLGNAPHAGGQWADNPVKASWDIGTLSYSDQLSLPGYSFAEYWMRAKGEPLPDLTRPTRAEIAAYLKQYPAAVEASENIRNSTNVTNIVRTSSGFHITPYNINCRALVLASGIFNIRLPPPRFLSPLTHLSRSARDGAILVIGSGFTAADIIISAPPDRRIIHLFNWDPVNHPSPLKACHGSAYPEYAWIYRQMKQAAEKAPFAKSPKKSVSKTPRKGPNSATRSFSLRDWSTTYDGFANARILSIAGDSMSDLSNSEDEAFPSPLQHAHSTTQSYPDSAIIEIGRSSFGHRITRTISSFHYAVGRRSTLSYLSPSLRDEVLAPAYNLPSSRNFDELQTPDHCMPRNRDFASAMGPSSRSPELISGSSLRGKIEDLATSTDASAAGLEVAPSVFAIGSLTGDSLVRFAYGGCCAVAGAIQDRVTTQASGDEASSGTVDGRLMSDWQRLEENWWIWS